MEVSAILSIVFGSTSLISIVSFFIYYKLNKRQKKAEVKATEEDTEAKNIMNENSKIDLGDRYIEGILKLQDTFQSNTDAVNNLSEKIDKVLLEQEQQNKLLAAIRAYLDGDLERWLKDNNINV